MASFSKRIAIGAIWTAADTWARQVTNFAVFTLLAWLLGPSAYGIMGLALVVPTILTALVTRGLPDAIVQRLQINALHLDSVFWLLVAAGVVLAAATAALAGPIARLYGEPTLSAVIAWTSLVLPFNAIGAVPGAVLKRELHFRLFAIRSLLSALLGGFVGVAMALSGCGVWSLVGLQLTRSFAEAAILLLSGRWKPRLRYSHAHCRELFDFARPVVFESFVRPVNDETPKVVIGFFLGTYEVGIYTLARRLLDLLVEVLLSPLFNLALPAVARVQGEPAKIDRFFGMTLRFTAMVTVPACIGMMLVAPDVVPYAFGPQWTGAVPVVQLIMVIGVLRTIDGLCAVTILALGHSMLLLEFHLVFAVVSPLLVAIGAQFGTAAALAGFVASNLLLIPPFLVAASRLARIDVLGALAVFPRVLLASALMAFVVLVWRDFASASTTPLLLIASSVALGIISYLGAILLVGHRDVLETRNTLRLLRA